MICQYAAEYPEAFLICQSPFCSSRREGGIFTSPTTFKSLQQYKSILPTNKLAYTGLILQPPTLALSKHYRQKGEKHHTFGSHIAVGKDTTYSASLNLFKILEQAIENININNIKRIRLAEQEKNR